MFETHCVLYALRLAFASAGRSIAARMAMMAITTSNSIRVNAAALFVFIFVGLVFTELEPVCHNCEWGHLSKRLQWFYWTNRKQIYGHCAFRIGRGLLH